MGDGKIIYIGDADEKAGFMLGGLGNVKTISAENKEKVLDELGDFSGLVLLSKKAETILGERLKEYHSTQRVFHTLGEKQGEEYETIDRIVKETIGFDLKKKRHGKDN